jgi:hypothetical protein
MTTVVRRIRTLIRRAVIFVVALGTAYAALLAFPQPLFAYQLDHGGVVVHTRRPIPEAMRATLERVRGRLERSPLYDANQPVHVFICEPRWVFALFALHKYEVGGIAQAFIGQHVFLRESDMDNDRLIGPSGTPVAADRPLSYFIAHEVTHINVVRHLGRLAYWRVPRWVNDGYADYVARDIDLTSALQRMKEGARELDPARSGLYLRYHLMVAYMLGRGGLDPAALVRLKDTGGDVERALLALDTMP